MKSSYEVNLIIEYKCEEILPGDNEYRLETIMEEIKKIDCVTNVLVESGPDELME